MKTILFLLSFGVYSLNAQNTDYHLKKGFMAHGYDVVAYFNHEAIEGDIAFSTTFNGIKYKFNSKENLEQFNKNSSRYIPQYGGYCAYAIAVKGEKVSINPKTFQIKNDKLYLFYNAWGTNTLELWKQRDVDQLIIDGDKIWETLKIKK